MGEEVFPWLKSLPLAPEYHPTLAEFQDPISYIFKIEQEASKYGICKIIPPVSPSSKKSVISNLNRSLSARNPDSSPTFTTRQQQIGFCPRKHHKPVQKPVWQSGERYTVNQFEVKAKSFEKSFLKNRSNSKKKNGNLTGLEVETIYWKAQVDKPISVEYANDMPGSAFDQTVGMHDDKLGKRELAEGLMSVGESEWNMRGVSRSKGSLLKFMKEEIPGVTSPMVYISMLFSWFAWHVEDHDFHSLNYMHVGAGKTWYGVPKDAAVAFEDVIRVHGYGGEINPIVTFATLGKKTTIMSPEVLVKAGVPCCRLVQNAGEFVVTFPRAYHSGFSHGFNCGEAANIATPGWLTVARDAAIRRASINSAPMVSHSQLLYDLALSFSSSEPTSIKPEPRSSRLKDKLKLEGESLVKRFFLQDMMQNNRLLHILGKGSSVVLLPEELLDRRIPSALKSTQNSDSDDVKKSIKNISSFYSRNKDKDASYKLDECDKKGESGIFSCVTCGVLCYACVAIIRPTEAAGNYLMSADCEGISDLISATGIFTANENASFVDPKSSTGKMAKNNNDGLFDVPVKSSDQIQPIDNDYLGVKSNPNPASQKVSFSSLGLLALTYDDSSDDDYDLDDHSHHHHERSNMKYINDQTFECSVEFGDLNKNENTCDEESSRMHIFCLEHALEVEQRLRPVGGVHVLLLCHQDYPSLDSKAKLMVKELETYHHIWTDLEFRQSNEKDVKWIQSALDSEEATHSNRDWAVKLGINLFYSASLSRSPLYSKQMPYNLVTYNAFGHISPNSPIKPKISGRQKKIVVAGKWCGKVWMSSQSHPLLVYREPKEHDETEINGSVLSRVDIKHEKQFENNLKKRKSVRVESKRVKSKFPKVEPSPSPPVSSGFKRQCRASLRKKQTRRFETDSEEEETGGGGTRLRKRIIKPPSKEFGVTTETKPKIKKHNNTQKARKARVIKASKEDENEEGEREFGCDIEGCNMSFESKQELIIHKLNICPVPGCGKKLFSHKYLEQHRRVHIDDRPLQCPWKGCKMTFKWAWARTEHIRVHTGARPYACSEDGCGQTFRFVSDFSRHKRKTGHSVTKHAKDR